MLKLDLPYPVSVNQYYGHAYGRVFVSREGKAYRKMVCSTLRLMKIKPMEGWLEVQVDLYPPDRRRRDCDIHKCLLDSLEHGGAYHDDYQISKLVTERHEPVPGGKVEVRINPYSKRSQRG